MVQEELKQLAAWFKSNKLTLNLHKCVSMLFDHTKKKNAINIEVDNVSSSQVECTRFLGIWIDDKLSWQSHFEKTIVKLKQNLNLLKVSKKFLNVHAKCLIYFAHIQSHILYCLSTWGCMLLNTQIAKLQQLQESCVKLIDCRKQKMN